MVQSEFKWQHNRDMADAAERLQELQSEIETNLETAMEEVTLRVMADARREVNVDTGRLRASIEQQVEKIAENVVVGYIGSNVEYALWHELDYPYLRPALESNRDFIRERFETAVQNAVEATE